MAQTVSRTFGALALLACPATPLAAQQAPTDAPPVPGDATAAPGDGSFDQAPANATQDDRFALDPGLAFEAYVAGNYERAFDLAVTFAGRGDAPSMRLLGQLYQSGFGVGRDSDEAAAWFDLASKAGDTEAQFLLATMKLDGVDIERDETGAAELLSLAQAAGHVSATQMYGTLLLEGRGTERNITRGAELIRVAAEAGDAIAQYTLGILYQEGAGVRQDNAEAYHWFERAARRGNVEAQVTYALGLLGQTAPAAASQDEARVLEDAVFWLQRAAEAGNPVAENRLAHAFAQGIGVRLDPVQAAYFHARAVAGGLADARLDNFVASLSPDQRARAQELVARDRAPANPFD